MTTPQKIMLTGATGYIGSRLAPHLLEQGHTLVCVTRNEKKLASRPWVNHPNVTIIENHGDDLNALTNAMQGCDVLYYLIHSMIVAGARYADRDYTLALNFAQSADKAGIKRIIYLGGLGELGTGLSQHLKSRREVEVALASTDVPVTVFRAAMIIGSGSASFEILRYIVERLPVMITPQWVHTECQPIGIRNVLHYLLACLDDERTIGRTLDIGGPDVMQYADIIQTMARQLGLPRRLIIPVPFITPRISSYWLHVVTPAPANIARPLAEGLRNRVVCRDNKAATLMPQELFSVDRAIQAALVKHENNRVDSTWADAGLIPGDPDWTAEHKRIDQRQCDITAPPDSVFDIVCHIGGDNGWYGADWLWRLRGWLDKIIGGPGLQRGRRNSEILHFGDTLDFWRVKDIQPNRRLLLQAEMKLPGLALLEFKVEPIDQGTRLTQTAHYFPAGLLGLVYWYSIAPMHHFVFNGMLRGIASRALKRARQKQTL